jgi:hypothetical protein
VRHEDVPSQGADDRGGDVLVGARPGTGEVDLDVVGDGLDAVDAPGRRLSAYDGTWPPWVTIPSSTATAMCAASTLGSRSSSSRTSRRNSMSVFIG